MELISEIKQLIINGRFKEAVTKSHQLADKLKGDDKNEFIKILHLLDSRHSTLRNKINKGIIRVEEENLEMNSLNDTLITLLLDFENFINRKEKEKKNTNTYKRKRLPNPISSLGLDIEEELNRRRGHTGLIKAYTATVVLSDISIRLRLPFDDHEIDFNASGQFHEELLVDGKQIHKDTLKAVAKFFMSIPLWGAFKNKRDFHFEIKDGNKYYKSNLEFTIGFDDNGINKIKDVRFIVENIVVINQRK